MEEISIKEGKNYEFIIKPNNTYIFKIENDSYNYYFDSEVEKLFYVFNDDHILEAANNKTKFKKNDKIYVNYYVNITENHNIKIKAEDKKKDEDDFPNWAVLLITLMTLGLCLLCISIVVIYITIKRSKIRNILDDKNENLTQE